MTTKTYTDDEIRRVANALRVPQHRPYRSDQTLVEEAADAIDHLLAERERTATAIEEIDAEMVGLRFHRDSEEAAREMQRLAVEAARAGGAML